VPGRRSPAVHLQLPLFSEHQFLRAHVLLGCCCALVYLRVTFTPLRAFRAVLLYLDYPDYATGQHLFFYLLRPVAAYRHMTYHLAYAAYTTSPIVVTVTNRRYQRCWLISS